MKVLGAIRKGRSIACAAGVLAIVLTAGHPLWAQMDPDAPGIQSEPDESTEEQTDPRFPGRARFERYGQRVLEIDELEDRWEDLLLVDVRTRLEYRTLRMDGAVHVDVEDPDFVQKVRSAFQGSDKEAVAFYCNGVTCYKSYRAVGKAMRRGMDAVYAFDAGIQAWVERNPSSAVLMGQRVMRIEDMISKEDFGKRTMEGARFAEEVLSDENLVLDVRPKDQQKTVLFPSQAIHIDMNNVGEIVSSVRMADEYGRQALLYDENGRQARWLDYWLQDAGLENYAFMEGGVHKFYRTVLHRP